jgi:phosphoglucomutase/phosphomannomutase
LVLRPSGTEPKAKAYVEVATPPRSRGQSDADWAALCAQADARAAQLSDAFRSLVTSIA